MIIEFAPWIELMFKVLVTLVVIQYGFYVVSRIHAYWIQAKRINLKNPKYSLEDLDRIYKAKEKRRQKE
jgi:hypothetical protein